MRKLFPSIRLLLLLTIFLNINFANHLIAAAAAAAAAGREREHDVDRLLSKGAVIVRVWNSQLNGGQHYGHVSLQTEHAYVSAWPSGRDRKDIPEVGALSSRAVFHDTVREDIVAETCPGRPDGLPELTIPLRLDEFSSMFIESDFSTIQEMQLRGKVVWHVGGSMTGADASDIERDLDATIDEGLHCSCASLVMLLLRRNGINALLPDFMNEGEIILNFITPDWVGNVASVAFTNTPRIKRMSFGLGRDEPIYRFSNKRIGTLEIYGIDMWHAIFFHALEYASRETGELLSTKGGKAVSIEDVKSRFIDEANYPVDLAASPQQLSNVLSMIYKTSPDGTKIIADTKRFKRAYEWNPFSYTCLPGDWVTSSAKEELLTIMGKKGLKGVIALFRSGGDFNQSFKAMFGDNPREYYPLLIQPHILYAIQDIFGEESFRFVRQQLTAAIDFISLSTSSSAAEAGKLSS